MGQQEKQKLPEGLFWKGCKSVREHFAEVFVFRLESLATNIALSPFVPIRLSHSSYVDEDFDSLALCDPMQRINCEVDSLPESCFDSGLSTLRDSNEYDSEVESKHQRISQRSQCPQESFAGDASDTDVSSRLTAILKECILCSEEEKKFLLPIE